MIRKTIILLLTFAAVISAVAFPLSLRWGIGCTAAGWGYIAFDYGNLRVMRGFSFNSVPHCFCADYEFRESKYLHVLPYYRFYEEGSWDIMLPLWLVFVATTSPAIIMLRDPLRRWRRQRRGLCINCRYDLTGNVSGICPECGREIAR